MTDSNVQLQDQLINDSGLERSPRNSGNQYSLKFGIILLAAMAATFIITYVLTKKTFETRNSNLGCDESINGTITVANQTFILFNDTIQKIIKSNHTAQWLCRDILCNPAIFQILLSMARSFLTSLCDNTDLTLYTNSIEKCVQFQGSHLVSRTNAACRLGLEGAFFAPANLNNDTGTGKAIWNQIVFSREPS